MRVGRLLRHDVVRVEQDGHRYDACITQLGLDRVRVRPVGSRQERWVGAEAILYRLEPHGEDEQPSPGPATA